MEKNILTGHCAAILRREKRYIHNILMYVYPVYLHINVPTLETSNKEDLSNILTGHWAAISRREKRKEKKKKKKKSKFKAGKFLHALMYK